ncbi:MAG: VWA domain-containing protein [Dehalococcoidia bacterium]
MSKRFTALLLLTLATSLLAQSSASAEGEVQVSIVDIDDSGYPTIEAVVTADVDGRPLADLDPGTLRILEGPSGSPVEARVLSVTPAVDAGTPLALILAVDGSGSMAGAPILEAQAAAASMIESLEPGDSGAILSFADQVEVLEGVTTDTTALTEALQRLTAFGNTTLYDAVAAAADQAANSGVQRRAVVLLSDGQDFGGLSTLTPDEALEAVGEARTVFYVVGYGDEIDRPFLEAIAERSGGRFFLAADTEDIATIYSSLEDLLRSQLIVTFESAAPEGAGERNLEVRVAVEDGSGAATRAYESSRPDPTPPPTEAPVETPVATPSPVAAPEDSSGSTLPLALGGLALLAVAGVVVVGMRRRTARSVAPVQLSALDRRPLPQEFSTLPIPAAAWLDVVAGPDEVPSMPLRDEPITIGSAPTCALRLSPAPGVAAEHARIWSRDGRPMLHHIAGDHETLINGARAEWASLQERDEVQIGPYVLRYRAVAPEPAQRAATGGNQ